MDDDEINLQTLRLDCLRIAAAGCNAAPSVEAVILAAAAMADFVIADKRPPAQTTQ